MAIIGGLNTDDQSYQRPASVWETSANFPRTIEWFSGGNRVVILPEISLRPPGSQ